MAHEGVDGTIGLGNALMLARRNATLLRVWYERYRGFRSRRSRARAPDAPPDPGVPSRVVGRCRDSDAVWNGFSLRLPFELAQQMPGAVHTLDYTSFYWPPWSPWGIAQLYRTPTCIMAKQSPVPRRVATAACPV